MSTKRNLVIGCDGTWNEPQQIEGGKTAPTNVVKFLRAMKKVKGGARTHYEKGVGTRAWEALPGGVYGYGLDKRVLGGYRFLRNRYAEPNVERADNRVFIIGFSRGSYTARRLAGLIHHSGVPKKSSDLELGLELYRNRDLKTARALKKEGRFFNIKIEMVGVWDTVKATNDADYHDQALPRCVKSGYHAMSIDEKRFFFPVLRWDKDPRALEVWFAGVHSDVGGGYAKQGLSDIALEWMIYRALDHGLTFKKKYIDEHVRPRYAGVQHDSLKGVWSALGSKTRKIRATDFVHGSVERRLGAKPNYRPDNLPANPRYWPPKKA